MSILIVTPRYNRTELGPYSDSCALLRKELLATGMDFDFFKLDNDSLITRARDVSAASFLDETDFMMMLNVDGDIEFEPADAARLWNLCYDGADVAVGLYRMKKPGANLAAWVDGAMISGEELEKRTEPFEVDFAGTGFMMIKRETLTNLRNAHPEWEYEEGVPEEYDPEKQKTRRCWGFFQDPIVDLGNGRFHLSEDYFFCHEVRKLGMKIIADPAIKLKHWGLYPY